MLAENLTRNEEVLFALTEPKNITRGRRDALCQMRTHLSSSGKRQQKGNNKKTMIPGRLS